MILYDFFGMHGDFLDKTQGICYNDSNFRNRSSDMHFINTTMCQQQSAVMHDIGLLSLCSF